MNTKTLVLAAFAGCIAAAPSYAQTRTTTTPPAVSSPSDTNKTTAAPVAGKNSFTEKEVTKRLADNGYTDISGVMLDKATGVWHAKATKSGQAAMVDVDYQGNITPRMAQ